MTTECKSKLGNVILTINNPFFAFDGIRLLSLASFFAVVIEEINIEPWIHANKFEGFTTTEKKIELIKLTSHLSTEFEVATWKNFEGTNFEDGKSNLNKLNFSHSLEIYISMLIFLTIRKIRA